MTLLRSSVALRPRFAARSSSEMLAQETAAQTVLLAITGHPCRSVERCAVIVLMPTVFDPLPHVADHIIETETVRGERADRSSLVAVPAAAAAVAIGIVAANIVAPRLGRLAASSSGVLVFRLRKQPIGPTGDL